MKKRVIHIILSFCFTVIYIHPSFAQDKKDSIAVLNIDEVVITGTKSRHILKNVPVETSLITNKEIENSGIQTVADATRWIAGVNISGGAPFGASRRFTSLVRGLPAQYSLVLIDGKRMKSEHIHSGVNMNLIPIEMVDRIEVVKGPASALYGSDAIGGVINILTKPIPEKAMYEATVSYGSYNTKNIGFNHGYRPGKFGYFLSGKYSDTDGINNNWYKQGNLLTKISYDLNNKNKLSFDSRYYKNIYSKSGSDVSDDDLILILEWNRKIKDNSSLNLSGSYNIFTGSAKNATNITAEISAKYQHEWKKHIITAGTEIRQEEFERLATPKKNQNIASVFAQDEIQIFSQLAAVFSLRADYHELTDFVLSPKGSLLWSITQTTNLRASAGRGFRAPSLQDLYEVHYFHNTYWRDGNENLEPEYSISYNLGIEQYLGNNIVARVSFFKNDFTNMITTVPTDIVEDDGFPVLQRENITTAHSQGIEFETKYKRENLLIILGYTYLDSEDNYGKVISYNPEHLSTLRLYYDIKRINLGIWLSVEDARKRYYKNKEGEVDKLNDYTLVNANIYKKLGKKISLFLTAGNIFDNKFESYEEGKTFTGYGRTFLGGIKLKI